MTCFALIVHVIRGLLILTAISLYRVKHISLLGNGVDSLPVQTGQHTDLELTIVGKAIVELPLIEIT